MDMGNEPNRLSDLYRNFTPAAVPFQSEKHLDFVEISEDGNMLLGSSNLTGRYWTGSVWYFTEAVPEKDTCLTGVDCTTGVNDGKFLDRNKKVVIGEDSGAVTVLYLKELEDDHTYQLKPIATRNDHDSSVLSISASSDKTKIVTGGMDMCIKLWNIDDLITEHTYRPAHCDHVTNVAFRPDSTDCVFASCSLDGCLLLWDIRQPRPATVLLETPVEGLSAVVWQPGQENFLTVGTVLGNIKSLDIRTANVFAKTHPFRRPIHRLASTYISLLAVCADSNEVKVLDCRSEMLDTIYSDSRHSDFVRGLSWHPQLQTLLTCGWDKRILSHSIPQQQ